MSVHAGGEQLKEKARFYSGDGIVDILIGLALVFGGFMLESDMVYLAGAMVVLFIPLSQGLKRLITEPRIDKVNFTVTDSLRRQKRLMVLIIAGVLTLLVGIGLFVFLTFNPGNSQEVWPFIAGTVGLLVITSLGLLGWMMQARRFILYLVVILLGIAAGLMLHIPLVYILFLCGLVFLSGGLYVMVRFMRAYPAA